jgi:hypothetical protein
MTKGKHKILERQNLKDYLEFENHELLNIIGPSLWA